MWFISTRSVMTVMLWLLVTPVALAQQEPDKQPARGAAQAQATRLTLEPVLDGLVASDAAWNGVAPAQGNFWQVQPAEGRPATQRTEVFIGYTDTALIIGVICHDEEPDKIIVSDTRRDSALDDIDSFQVIIDGFLDRQNGFVFGTSAAGVQYDGQVIKEGSGAFGSGGGGFNLNWDTNWDVAAQVTESGWSAEFHIPFKSLRYGSGDVQTWGINFQRNIRRNNEIVYWAPLERQYNLYRVSDA
ncbi:MAG: carbohydrate binding family 9 domain-containing protein, partial [Proteobacteria bacterium]|nr:carbohydrate binding family 9 domain-containing protein [Pseudomonadota bacterium]